ncbi:uncharacterized protein LOC106175850 [Lingula anatina]|uniref:Uncharacterized protein LOC106175850 n=1 Tax=Lingula anatina TaxID=7574 RepID=A0A1S3JT11_LINAN|nr:uncharacterized protein LOC106175850 [Lingula anatina]|eukprot:XP_013413462.1 uncharacterized protein LOC106175850 [Lingula anatina]
MAMTYMTFAVLGMQVLLGWLAQPGSACSCVPIKMVAPKLEFIKPGSVPTTPKPKWGQLDDWFCRNNPDIVIRGYVVSSKRHVKLEAGIGYPLPLPGSNLEYTVQVLDVFKESEFVTAGKNVSVYVSVGGHSCDYSLKVNKEYLLRGDVKIEKDEPKIWLRGYCDYGKEWRFLPLGMARYLKEEGCK